MSPTINLLILCAGVLAVTSLIGHYGLKGFRDWIGFKRLELNETVEATLDPAGGRIEIADLRERVRKLEAIAAGIDP